MNTRKWETLKHFVMLFITFRGVAIIHQNNISHIKLIFGGQNRMQLCYVMKVGMRCLPGHACRSPISLVPGREWSNHIIHLQHKWSTEKCIKKEVGSKRTHTYLHTHTYTNMYRHTITYMHVQTYICIYILIHIIHMHTFSIVLICASLVVVFWKSLVRVKSFFVWPGTEFQIFGSEQDNEYWNSQAVWWWPETSMSARGRAVLRVWVKSYIAWIEYLVHVYCNMNFVQGKDF